MMHWGSWGAGEWVLMSLAMLLFWALIVAGVVALGRSWTSGRQTPRPHAARSSADQLLDERFARGQIDAEEYRHRRELLHTGQ